MMESAEKLLRCFAQTVTEHYNIKVYEPKVAAFGQINSGLDKIEIGATVLPIGHSVIQSDEWDDPVDAVMDYIDQFLIWRQMAKDRLPNGGMMLWRTQPELCSDRDFDRKKPIHQVFSRLTFETK